MQVGNPDDLYVFSRRLVYKRLSSPQAYSAFFAHLCNGRATKSRCGGKARSLEGIWRVVFFKFLNVKVAAASSSAAAAASSNAAAAAIAAAVV